jgi:hypothetical protein
MFMRTLGVCLAVLSLAACQKEISEPATTTDALEASRALKENGSCKVTAYELIYDAAGIVQLDEYTYKNGRLYEWFVSYGGFFRMEYDHRGRMTGSKYYVGTDLVYTIEFIRRNNRVEQEIWRDGITGDVVDEVTNEYNQRGQIIKSTSPGFDYFVLYDHDQKGNVLRWRFYSGGVLTDEGVYTYNTNAKNPEADIKGLDYQFAYSNGALFSGPNWYSSEKITLFDPNGDPTVLYDLDPSKTIFNLRKGNLPDLVTFTDRTTQSIYTTRFEYKACNDDCNERSARSNPGLNQAGKISGKGKALKY